MRCLRSRAFSSAGSARPSVSTPSSFFAISPAFRLPAFRPYLPFRCPLLLCSPMLPASVCCPPDAFRRPVRQTPSPPAAAAAPAAQKIFAYHDASATLRFMTPLKQIGAATHAATPRHLRAAISLITMTPPGWQPRHLRTSLRFISRAATESSQASLPAAFLSRRTITGRSRKYASSRRLLAPPAADCASDYALAPRLMPCRHVAAPTSCRKMPPPPFHVASPPPAEYAATLPSCRFRRRRRSELSPIGVSSPRRQSELASCWFITVRAAGQTFTLPHADVAAITRCCCRFCRDANSRRTKFPRHASQPPQAAASQATPRMRHASRIDFAAAAAASPFPHSSTQPVAFHAPSLPCHAQSAQHDHDVAAATSPPSPRCRLPPRPSPPCHSVLSL